MTGIKKLAQYLNISTGTVSRALNNKPDVNEETRQRVKKAAEKLGYVPNQSGRSLRQGTTNIIAFMFVTSKVMAESADNLFLGIANGIQNVIAQHDLDLLIIPRPPSSDPQETLHRIASRRLADGIIIANTQMHDDRIPFLLNAKIPFVSLGRSNMPVDFSWIDLDFEGAARETVERLVARGHRRIAICLPGDNIMFGQVYFQSYKDTLQRLGLPFDPDLVFRILGDEAGGEEAAIKLMALETPATAVMLTYELLAQRLYEKLSMHGIQVGRDVAVVGFRDHPQHKLLQPRLTAFKVDPESVGKALGYKMLANLPTYAAQYQHYKNNIVVPMRLLPGQSDDFIL
jgi:DNA-binding LacI/PurR family transcriptional regulator